MTDKIKFKIGETYMKDKINIGLIGLGGRGIGLLKLFLLHQDVNIIAVCDSYEDRCEEAAKLIEEAGQQQPYKSVDYNDIIAIDKVNAIILCTSWDNHIDIAIQAMEAGKYVGCEVGGAYSITQCWKLIDAYERTKVPVMMLENCIYGREELMILNMVKLGLFGEVVHCSGGYLHDLREEVALGKENRHYRLNNYIHRNAENYPTHELGPIARILDINHGNRMLTLTSMASKARGLKEYIKSNKPDDKELLETEFNQGDVVNTFIKCANGETILLTLDTTLPRYYSRGFTVKGTKGMYTEENQSIFLDNSHNEYHFDWKEHWGNVENYREEYDHPIWKKYIKEGVKEGHGGMDWLVFCDFIESVKNKEQTPIDVYDMASWMCISTLSEDSIALGGQPVAIPDFTNGAWMSR